MSLTDDSGNELVAIFECEFVPAAQHLSRNGIETLTTGFDPACSSYYRQRDKTGMEPADFEMNLDDLEEVKRHWRSYWTPAECEILEGLLNKVLALAVNYKSVRSAEDVSPFIYAMF